MTKGSTEGKVLEVNAGEFEEEVLKSELPILVDFWAPWCPPCKMMIPVLEELNEIAEDKFRVAKVNVEEEINQDLAQEYDIRSIPNMKLFKNGKVIHEYVGLTDAKTLKNSVIEAINR